MKIEFDIKYRPQIESGEYKVVTKGGQNVRIVCWDMNTCNGTLLVALVKGNGGEYEKTRSYTLEGKCKSASEDASLFVVTPEPELTEFEQAVGVSIGSWNAKSEESKARVREVANKLLKLAKKQLDSYYDQELKEAYKEADRVQYNRGYADGKADVLKDIPKWHKTEEYLTFLINSRGMLAFVGEDRSTPVVCHNNHYLTLRELLKLPKEE